MTTPANPSGEAIPEGWRKSSYSGGGTGTDCVEVAVSTDGVCVRDSKDPDGPVLRFTSAEMRAFLRGVKAGDLDDLV